MFDKSGRSILVNTPLPEEYNGTCEGMKNEVSVLDNNIVVLMLGCSEIKLTLP